MDIKNIKKAASILYKARLNLKRIEKLPFECTPKNKKEAYEIQENLIKNYKIDKIIGTKIGCTNKAAQKQININEPFYGNILKNYSSKSKCILKSKDFFKPFIEPEFSFKIKKNTSIYNKKFSIKNINKYIDYILPSIEVVDSRFNDWKKIGINNLIADNGVNAYWIYGKKTKDLSNFNLNNHIVKLYINNKLLEIGNSKNVLKNPLNSIVWLLNYLSKQGKNFLSESFISTGTCTPAIPIKKGDIIVADFGKLGKIEVNYI